MPLSSTFLPFLPWSGGLFFSWNTSAPKNTIRTCKRVALRSWNCQSCDNNEAAEEGSREPKKRKQTVWASPLSAGQSLKICRGHSESSRMTSLPVPSSCCWATTVEGRAFYEATMTRDQSQIEHQVTVAPCRRQWLQLLWFTQLKLFHWHSDWSFK